MPFLANVEDAFDMANELVSSSAITSEDSYQREPPEKATQVCLAVNGDKLLLYLPAIISGCLALYAGCCLLGMPSKNDAYMGYNSYCQQLWQLDHSLVQN